LKMEKMFIIVNTKPFAHLIILSLLKEMFLSFFLLLPLNGIGNVNLINI
jgi:hypothetical protein